MMNKVPYRSYIKYVFALVLISLSSPVCAETPVWLKQAADDADKGGYALIRPDELKALYDSGKDFLIVDVRPDYEYKGGCLPKAANLEFDLGERLSIRPDKKKEFVRLLGPDKKRMIVLYCRSFR